MSMEKTVRLALKDKNPALFKELSATGELTAFAADLAEQINEQIVTLTLEMAEQNGANKAQSFQEKVGILNQARSLATETVLAEMLDFPQDQTFPQSPDATTLSATAT